MVQTLEQERFEEINELKYTNVVREVNRISDGAQVVFTSGGWDTKTLIEDFLTQFGCEFEDIQRLNIVEDEDITIADVGLI